MAFTLSQRLVRETVRTAARSAETNSSTVSAELDKLADAVNATGVNKGRVLLQAHSERTISIYAFPEGYSPGNVLEVIDACRQYIAGAANADAVLALLDADYAVKRQRVTAVSTVGASL